MSRKLPPNRRAFPFPSGAFYADYLRNPIRISVGGGPATEINGGNGAGVIPVTPGPPPASGVTPGTYGDATHVGQFVVDASGLITSAVDVPITGGGGGGTSYIPLALGVEPLTFVSDGFGQPILIPYIP